MIQLDETFLQSVGIKNLPEDEQKELLQHIYEELELRVGEKLAEGMSDDQLAEFEYILDHDEEKIRQWLQANKPDYEQQEDFKALRKEAGISEGQPAPLEVLADYTAAKWLEVNRPDYQATVNETLEELKEEIIHNRDVIMGEVK